MRLPHWLKTPHYGNLHDTKQLLRKHKLSTVCEEARCPNRGECFSRPTATFLILGPNCSRNCGFCSVSSSVPLPLDPDEPIRVAEAAAEMGLKYVVITSVTRDDLPDGGAGHFAMTVNALRKRLPEAGVEVLTPDFQGSLQALKTVLEAGPDVYNHNMETVKRLYSFVRPQADYQRSLSILSSVRDMAPDVAVKSGLMLGLGETMDEVSELLSDLRRSGCALLTIGQYLRPTRNNIPVVEYVPPRVFDELREEALGMGFRFVASGPLVRSSMNAEAMYQTVLNGSTD